MAKLRVQSFAVSVDGFAGIGAWILGRNMFGPLRGPWPDVPAFVLTHHARESIPMKGGTTFHFVTDGIHAALQKAKAAAGGRDVRLGGDLDLRALGYEVAKHFMGERAMHVTLRKRS